MAEELVVFLDRDIDMLLELPADQGWTERFNWLMPFAAETEALALRLDSKVYLFQTLPDKNEVDLYEVYSIKAGPQIRNKIGNWSETQGFSQLVSIKKRSV